MASSRTVSVPLVVVIRRSVMGSLLLVGVFVRERRYTSHQGCIGCPLRLSTAVCDALLGRHGLARRPRRRKGYFTQASAHGGHVAVIPDTLAGRQGSTNRFAHGLGSAQEPCGALQLLLRHHH